MAANKICRICLLTDVPLKEMNITHRKYFEDICSSKTGQGKLMLCCRCFDALKDSLKFKNKCVKANKVLQEWKKNKSCEKPLINSLHNLLSSKNHKSNIANQIITKKRRNINKEEIITNKDCYNSDNEYTERQTDNKHNNINKEKDIKIEDVKNINFEVKNCEDNFVSSDGFEYDIKDLKNEDTLTDDIQDQLTSDVDLKIKPRNVKKDPENSKKIIREYNQYAEIFDVELFNTIEDARSELLSRVRSEPYVSAEHRCELCYSTFKSDKLLLFHRKWHNVSSPLECPVCSFRFLTRKSLRNHRSKCHRGKFACKLCPLVTYHESVMKRHCEKHQGKTYKCDCGRAFKHMSTYLNHKRNVHESAHVCLTCARTFVSRLGLLNHAARAHQTKPVAPSTGGVQCALCELTFPNQRVYNVHVLSTHKHTQTAKEMIACRSCGLTFDDATQLKEHKKQIHLAGKDDNGPIKCELCGAEGKGRAWRLQHYRMEHPHVKCQNASEDTTRHMCDQCGRMFSSMYVLRDHLHAHAGLRPWACRAPGACGAAFSSNSARAQHEARHAPPRACPHCPATFRTSSGLCMHKRRHVGSRSHACAACGRAFLLPAQLREHARAVHQRRRRAPAPRDRRAAPRYRKPVVARIQLEP